MRKAEGVYKTNIGQQPQSQDPAMEEVVANVQQAWYGALGDLKQDAVLVGKSLSEFPYSSAIRLIGVAVVLYGGFWLFRRFGKIYSKLS